jgi:hypothetical protein
MLRRIAATSHFHGVLAVGGQILQMSGGEGPETILKQNVV